MEIDVIPIRTYLTETPLQRLLEIREKWEAVEGFRPSYKAEKLQRILQIVEFKRELDSQVSQT